MEDSNKKVMKFSYELGQLKRVKRSGWWMLGVNNPESVAEHSFRAGMLAYMIAKMENANPEKTAFMALINDLHEARLNDLHKVGHRYIDFRKAEIEALREQVFGLPNGIGDDILNLYGQYSSDSSKEGMIAKDADLLECAIQAREYIDIGHKDAQNWIDNVEPKLKTESAKKLFKTMMETEPNSWWQGLKKTER
jgi:putative hydrolase of HD superfamily